MVVQSLSSKLQISDVDSNEMIESAKQKAVFMELCNSSNIIIAGQIFLGTSPYSLKPVGPRFQTFKPAAVPCPHFSVSANKYLVIKILVQVMIGCTVSVRL